MGREVKHVPLDFDWPLKKVWPGFCNPWYVDCHNCNGTGYIESESATECTRCNGFGLDPFWEAIADEWQQIDPPEGEGYQLWETVTEGSPISPVFASEEEFVEYLMLHENCTKEAAQAFIKSGWAPSFVMFDNRGMISGVQAAEELGND